MAPAKKKHATSRATRESSSEAESGSAYADDASQSEEEDVAGTGEEDEDESSGSGEEGSVVVKEEGAEGDREQVLLRDLPPIGSTYAPDVDSPGPHRRADLQGLVTAMRKVNKDVGTRITGPLEELCAAVAAGELPHFVRNLFRFATFALTVAVPSVLGARFQHHGRPLSLALPLGRRIPRCRVL